MQLDAARTREAELLTTISTLQDTISTQGVSAAMGKAEANLVQLRKENEQYRANRHNTDQLVLELRLAAKEAQRRLERTQQTPLYRAALVIASSTRSWRNFIAAPHELLKIARSARAYANANRVRVPITSNPSDYVQAAETAVSLADKAGLDAALEWLTAQNFRKPVQARVLGSLAKHVRVSSPTAAVRLAKQALELAPSESRAKRLAFAMMESGASVEAAEVLRAATAGGAVLNASEQRRADELFALERIYMKGMGSSQRTRLGARSSTQDKSLLLFASQSLPVHSTVTALRAHAAAQNAQAAGWKVAVVTPPAYGTVDGHEAATEIHGVSYYRLPAIDAAATNLDEYAYALAPLLARLASELACSIIQAPSNISLLYPSLIGAQTKGLRLVVDCNRLAMSPPPEATVDLRASLELSAMIHADGVIARTSRLGQALRSQGIDSAKVCVVPETSPLLPAVTPDPRWRESPSLSGRMVLGFVGDADEDIELEVLPDLLHALINGGKDVALAVFGSGTRFQRLKAQCERLGHADRVLFANKPRPEALSYAFGSLDVAVVPPPRGSTIIRAHYALADAEQCPGWTLAAGHPDRPAASGNTVVSEASLADMARVVGELCARPRLREQSEAARPTRRVGNSFEDLTHFYQSLLAA